MIFACKEQTSITQNEISGNGRRWEAIDNRLKYEEDPPRYHAEKQIKGQGSGGKDVAAFLMPTNSRRKRRIFTSRRGYGRIETERAGRGVY